MSANNPDIEILVLSYNRASLIGETLESLLTQVQPASRICVLDNGSTDGTGNVVRSFSARGVELVCRNSNDHRACWLELQEMARGPWTMLFHDDDLLHPHYLRDVSAILARAPQATVVVSAMRTYGDPERAGWDHVRGNRYRIITGRQLAARLYGGFPMPFCSAIYRTDVLKKSIFPFETYGKIFDRPFVIESARAGSAVLMLDPYIKYRVHSRQDSTDQSTGPFLPEVFALQRYYRTVLGEQLSDYPGRIFLRRNYRNLLREYNRLNRNSPALISQNTFFLDAIEAGAASIRSVRYGKWYAALTHLPRHIEKEFKVLFRRRHSYRTD